MSEPRSPRDRLRAIRAGRVSQLLTRTPDSGLPPTEPPRLTLNGKPVTTGAAFNAAVAQMHDQNIAQAIDANAVAAVARSAFHRSSPASSAAVYPLGHPDKAPRSGVVSDLHIAETSASANSNAKRTHAIQNVRNRSEPADPLVDVLAGLRKSPSENPARTAGRPHAGRSYKSEAEITGDDKDDTIFSSDSQPLTSAPRAPVFATEDDRQNAATAMRARIEDTVWEIIHSRRKQAPDSIAADFLEHYLNGNGQAIWIDPTWLGAFSEVDRGLSTLKRHFSQGLIDPGYSNNAKEKALVMRLLHLADGDTTTGEARWDAHLFDGTPTFLDKVESAFSTPSALSDMDLWNAIGTANLSGVGTFNFIRRGLRIVVSGTVNVRLGGYDAGLGQPVPERYDWEKGTTFVLPGLKVVSGDDMIFLEKNGSAQTYDIFSDQEYSVTGEIAIENGRLVLKEPLTWTPTPAVPSPSGSRVYSPS
jgi:hypothetical protein